MRKLFVLLFLTSLISWAQKAPIIKSDEVEMFSMSEAYTKPYKDNGNRYFLNGSDKPFTGFLCARYDNGELESLQQYENGVGNGIWINYDPDGRKECQGTYKDNRVEGPVTFYYEDGSIKSEGQYRSFKRPIGLWIFYDRKGNVVSKRRYTR